MTPIEGVDYSTDKPELAGLVAVGKHFIARYVGPGTAPKQLTRAEAEDATAHGLSIVANAEGTANGLLSGAAAGAAWARQAHTMAVNCGMPPTRPVYLSCDFDVTAAQWPQVADALRGAAGVLGADRVGLYGGYDAIAWAVRDHVARWLWQTAAWSEGRWHPMAHLQQYRNGVSLVGGTVDLDRAMVADYGQWTVGALPTLPEEKPMPLNTDGDFRAIMYRVQALLTGVDPVDLHVDGQPTDPNALHRKLDTIIKALAEVRPESPVSNADVALVLGEVRTLVKGLHDAPLVDAVAVASAIGNLPELLGAITAGVAARLAGIHGEITLTGSLSGGIVPPSQ